MTEKFDMLFAIAQIAVTFAGFGAIATAFGSRDSTGTLRIDAGRLINMIITSLCCVLMAIVPPTIAQFHVDERWVWGGAAAVYLATGAVALPAVLLRTRRMAHHGVLSLPALIIGVVLMLAGFTAVTLCLFDIPGGNNGATYVAGLTLLLCNAVTLFYVLVQSLLKPYAPDTSQPAAPTERSES